MIKVTGFVGINGKAFIGQVINIGTSSVVKFAFESNTSGGGGLVLAAGTAANFNAGTIGTQLGASGAPGFQFFSIVDASKLSGLDIYVLRSGGTAASAEFTVNIE